jgi:PIF1-like helicase
MRQNISNMINLPNLPPHLPQLKVGAPVILLRNLSPSTGVARLRVARVSQRVLECEILAGKPAGTMVDIVNVLLRIGSMPIWRC